MVYQQGDTHDCVVAAVGCLVGVCSCGGRPALATWLVRRSPPAGKQFLVTKQRFPFSVEVASATSQLVAMPRATADDGDLRPGAVYATQDGRQCHRFSKVGHHGVTLYERAEQVVPSERPQRRRTVRLMRNVWLLPC